MSEGTSITVRPKLDNETISADVELSRHLLRVTIIPNLLGIPAGIIAVVLSALTIVIIARSKHLRTKCFAILAGNASANLLIGLGYIVSDSIRTYRYQTGRPEILGVWECCREVALIVFAQSLSLGMNTALVIERLLAIFYSIPYKTWNYRRVTLPLIAGAFLFASTILAVHVQNSWTSREVILISCGVDDTLYPATQSWLSGVQIAASGLVVILHGLLAYGVRRHKKKFRIVPSSGVQAIATSITTATVDNETLKREMAKFEADMRFMKAISGIVITHICIMAVRFAVVLVNAWSTEGNRVFANRFGGLVVVLSSTIDFFLLFFMSSRFRDATRKFFNKSLVSVGPIGG